MSFNLSGSMADFIVDAALAAGELSVALLSVLQTVKLSNATISSRYLPGENTNANGKRSSTLMLRAFCRTTISSIGAFLGHAANWPHERRRG